MKPKIILEHLRSQISCLVIISNWYLAKNDYCCVVVVHWIDWKDNERRPVEMIRRHRNLRLSLLKWMCVKTMRPENVFFLFITTVFIIHRTKFLSYDEFQNLVMDICSINNNQFENVIWIWYVSRKNVQFFVCNKN